MAEYIDSTIRSVLHGTFRDMEVIVIDDGSTDGTKSVVEKYNDSSDSSYDPRVFYEYQHNSGKSAAVNRGIDIANGIYITVVDADDQITEESLQIRYEARFSESDSLCDLIIGGFEVFDHQATYGKRSPPSSFDPCQLHDRFYLDWKTPFHLNACLISQELIDRTGGLDETIHRCIDGDYALRLLREAESIKVVDEVVYRYRKHRSSAFERVKYRLKTAWYRPKVVWKNYNGWRKWTAVPFGIAMDTGKLVYELIDSYKQ